MIKNPYFYFILYFNGKFMAFKGLYFPILFFCTITSLVGMKVAYILDACMQRNEGYTKKMLYEEEKHAGNI